MRDYQANAAAAPETDRRSQINDLIGAIDSAQQDFGDLLTRLEKRLDAVLRPEPATTGGGVGEPREAPTCSMAACLLALNEQTRDKSARLARLLDRLAL